MNTNGRAGAQAPALPDEKGPAFENGSIVYDMERREFVRIIGTVRYEHATYVCVGFHKGAHTKNCIRHVSVWYQYAVTHEIDKGKHNNGVALRHQHERNLTADDGNIWGAEADPYDNIGDD